MTTAAASHPNENRTAKGNRNAKGSEGVNQREDPEANPDVTTKALPNAGTETRHIYKLAVRTLVGFVCREGDIHFRYDAATDPREGIEAQRQLQRQRTGSYQREVAVRNLDADQRACEECSVELRRQRERQRAGGEEA